MQATRAILVAALCFVAILGVLTIAVLVRNGPDVLTGVSLVVLAMVGFGVVGALREPPEQ